VKLYSMSREPVNTASESPWRRWNAPDSGPYGPRVTIRQLLTHTSGIPNPLPLRWVHPVSQQDFKESAALAAVLKNNPKLSNEPGCKFAYSNVGYWLLGEVVARVTGGAFEVYVCENVFRPLELLASDLSYVIPDLACHAQGYLEKYSLMNLGKRFLIDHELIGTYEGRWLRIEPHYVDGPAFGGLVGTSQGFGAFLRDQLRTESVLFDPETRRLFFSQQYMRTGKPVPMTLGWHIGAHPDAPFYFKEGGGGGFHCMMRVYRNAGVATVIMANATRFDARAALDAIDPCFLCRPGPTGL
jgi:D-alanyl-D-alanine carboxypeptidase